MLKTKVRLLTDTADLYGAGVYAIYYTGGFPIYSSVTSENIGGKFGQPIYVGKAIPEGGRKGGVTFDSEKGRALRDRLRAHAKSIQEAENIDLGDFYFQCLLVEDIWIPLGENVLIDRYRPIWNLVIDGFGNKDPGNRRATQYRSPWDVLHPGRQFAVKLAKGSLTIEALYEKIERFIARGVSDIPLERASGDLIDDRDESN